MIQVKFHGVDQMDFIALFGKWKGIDPGRTADVKNGRRSGEKIASQNYLGSEDAPARLDHPITVQIP